MSCKTREDIVKAIQKIGEERQDLTFGIDGAVIKVDNLHLRELLGTTYKVPNGRLHTNIHQSEKKLNYEILLAKLDEQEQLHQWLS